MKIIIIIEGQTETAFIKVLRDWLNARVETRPTLRTLTEFGRVPTGEKLKRKVRWLLDHDGYDHVIALTDVYTGSRDFKDAEDAKIKMRAWVGNEARFHPHAAQHDFEAWLLPFWPEIQRKAGHNLASPGPHPEKVNHQNPPAHRIIDIFRRGGRRDYSKPRDAPIILTADRLEISATQCPELKSLLNTLLLLCEATPLE